MPQSDRMLILSDGKPGHRNQSTAFARHLGYTFDLCRVRYRSRPAKALSYLLDWIGVYWTKLFLTDRVAGQYSAVVSAGSETYYANKALARHLKVRSVAIMLPKSYRLNFDLVIAQQHDNPPSRDNIVQLPINLTYVEPQGLVTPEPGRQYVSLIIGGDSVHGQMDCRLLMKQLKALRHLFPDHGFWVTTSRRTPVDVEKMLGGFHFDRAFFFSHEPVNPIADFLLHSDYVFITADSSSMISEAVSYGRASVEVLPFSNDVSGPNKFTRFLSLLTAEGCLHIFDGTVRDCRHKIPVGKLLKDNAKHLFKGKTG